MYLTSSSPAALRFFASIKDGRGLKPSARDAGINKEVGYRWLREKYPQSRRNGISASETIAELGFTTSRLMGWEAEVERPHERNHLRVDADQEVVFWAAIDRGQRMETAAIAAGVARSALRAGGMAVIIAGLAGITWFALELLPPVLGFDDTDNPAVSLDYLRQHPQVYPFAGVTLFIMAIAYIVASFAVSDALAPRTSSITRRSLSALGLFAAAFVFMHGVLRESVGPLLYIDSRNSGWGESAYLTIQMLGTHGFAQAGLLTLSVWAVGICVAGARSHSLPMWLCVLGLVAGLRLVMLIAGPFMTAASASDPNVGTALNDVPEFLWLGSVALIPLGMFWWLALGVVLLVKSRPNREQRPVKSAR